MSVTARPTNCFTISTWCVVYVFNERKKFKLNVCRTKDKYSKNKNGSSARKWNDREQEQKTYPPSRVIYKFNLFSTYAPLFSPHLAFCAVFLSITCHTHKFAAIEMLPKMTYDFFYLFFLIFDGLNGFKYIYILVCKFKIKFR